MKSKIEVAALKLLINGHSISKFDVSKSYPCTAQSAQRVLRSMHKAGVMRVCNWIKNGDRNIPVYKADGGEDVLSPLAKSNAERCMKKYYSDPDIYIAKQRAYRLVQQIKEKKFGYETNPYRELYRIAVQRSDRVCD